MFAWLTERAWRSLARFAETLLLREMLSRGPTPILVGTVPGAPAEAHRALVVPRGARRACRGPLRLFQETGHQTQRPNGLKWQPYKPSGAPVLTGSYREVTVRSPIEWAQSNALALARSGNLMLTAPLATTIGMLQPGASGI